MALYCSSVTRPGPGGWFRRAVCLTERCCALRHALRGEFLKAANDLFRDHHASHPVGEIIAKF